ncbi:hypothetical protein Sste5346_000382 [Sporothrix stenoceras]|uniref:DUF2415 domain-containing protein n=1 Tax=Sporothrix stenoceras TaxID=5173 RepID=A0ABR3ZQX8_9PEZI
MSATNDDRGPESLPQADGITPPSTTPASETGPAGEPTTAETGSGSATAATAVNAIADPDADTHPFVSNEVHESASNPPDTLEVDFNNAHAAYPLPDWAHGPLEFPTLLPLPGLNAGSGAAASDLDEEHAPPVPQAFWDNQQGPSGTTAGGNADQPGPQQTIGQNMIPIPTPSQMMQDFYHANDSFASFFFSPFPIENQPHNGDGNGNAHGGDSLVPLLPPPLPSYYNVTVPYGNGYAVHHGIHIPSGLNVPDTTAPDAAGADSEPATGGPPPPEPNLDPTIAQPYPLVSMEPLAGPMSDMGMGMEMPTGLVVPVAFTNTAGLPMNSELSPTNADLKRFLLNWQASTQFSVRGVPTPRGPVPTVVPSSTGVDLLIRTDVDEVTTADLNGDHCDYQGIKWATMGVTRREARAFRERRYLNYCSNHQDAWIPHRSELMPHNTESYFQFRRMKMRKAPYLAHFQLRNLLAAPSKSRVFYADRRGIVRQYNFATNKTEVALRYPQELYIQISTMAAGQGVLVSGGFNGEYCTMNTDSEYSNGSSSSENKIGTYKNLGSGISNHIQIHSARRSGGPVAAFASNDSHVRVMDLETQTIVSNDNFNFAVNCTAVSPDRRLRVVVGDRNEAYIVAAERERNMMDVDGASSPEILQKLGGHADYGFACAWADDGYTIATGNQDRAIMIWDARKTSTASGIWTPVVTLRTTMAGARSLQFSPAGSGKRVLVAAEEADTVHIIDAQSFDKRQSFDVFGELAGLSFSENGQDLFVLCTDPTRGGILHFERDGFLSTASTFDETPIQGMPGYSDFDWPNMSGRSYWQRSRGIRRRLRAAAAASMSPF